MLKSFADWGPIAQIRANWEPLTELFAATWNLLMALSTPVMDFLKNMFDWSPLGMIINNWSPITAWFQQLWEKLRPIIEPIMKWFGGGEGGEGIIQNATNKVNAFTEAQQKRNVGAGGGTGELLLADASQSAAARQAMNNQAFGISNNQLLQQTAATNGQKLNGELNINLNGAPPGTTIEQPKTNQPGLNIKPNVGTRTVGVMKG
jgi:hypothetical protein